MRYSNTVENAEQRMHNQRALSKENKRKTLPLLFIALLAPPVHAQNSYTFEQSTAAYTELPGGIVCDHSLSESHFVHDLDGETLWFYGVPFPMGGLKTIIIGSKGYLRVDNDSSAIYADALTTDLLPIDGTSDVRYEITGSAGERVLKAQWRNWRLENGPPDNFANWQIWYYQATGVIDMRYGPNSGGALDYDGTDGPFCGIFYGPDDFLSIYEKLWLTENALAPTLDSLPVINWSTLFNLPAANTVYRFTPRFTLTGLQHVAEAPVLDARYDPAAQELIVRCDQGNVMGVLRLTDAVGRSFGEWSLRALETRIPLPDPRTGVYLLRIQSDRGSALALRFVVH
ncbi:MAG: hypothetical protein IPI07_06930 [Flavobacteriales bacterium]|jgi:hypothetical protein|nr:hypothetical protein [Flavobacteriales bacterium]MBK7753960.1 hypothetical protein [Flavobacteriales bacterium]MBK9077285.1 hypothetical protein [Flavobacteriales bacterium]MBK9538701.1 hypothetical protein [Flavobacteriales bacterium]